MHATRFWSRKIGKPNKLKKIVNLIAKFAYAMFAYVMPLVMFAYARPLEFDISLNKLHFIGTVHF